VSSTGRFELFLDLLYVAILANFSENLADHATGDGLVKYIVRALMLLLSIVQTLMRTAYFSAELACVE
jgi:low temperature requirement protein LtrA